MLKRILRKILPSGPRQIAGVIDSFDRHVRKLDAGIRKIHDHHADKEPLTLAKLASVVG